MSNITTDDGDRRKKRAVWVTERELDRLKTQAESHWDWTLRCLLSV
jgi:hypothetical protein